MKQLPFLTKKTVYLEPYVLSFVLANARVFLSLTNQSYKKDMDVFRFPLFEAHKRFKHRNHFSYLMSCAVRCLVLDSKQNTHTTFRNFETIWLCIKPTEIVTKYCLQHSCTSIYIMMVIYIWWVWKLYCCEFSHCLRVCSFCLKF